jgi:hypothetical protein
MASVETGDRGVPVGVAKVCDRVSRGVYVVFRGDTRGHDAMFRGADNIVRPSLQEIACVHDDGIWNGCRADEVSLRGHDF